MNQGNVADNPIKLFGLVVKIQKKKSHRLHDNGELGIGSRVEVRRNIRLVSEVFGVPWINLAEAVNDGSKLLSMKLRRREGRPHVCAVQD